MKGRLVIEWTRATLRMALAELGRKPKLKLFRTVPLGSQDLTAEALAQLYRALGVSVKTAVLVIPREQVITRGVRFPATQTSELAQMVELYARAQLPYAREQMILDFAVLEQKAGFSNVVIVACQRDVIDKPLALLKQIGLEVQCVTVTSWGVAEWFRHLPKQSELPEPTLIVHLDDARTDLVLVADKRLLSSRSIGQGTLDWADLDQVVELLAIEVDRSRASLRKELPDLDVQSVVLTGFGALNEWALPLNRRLGLPVQVVPSDLPFAPWKSAPDTGVSPVVAAAVAVGDLNRLLHLTPPELKGQVKSRHQLNELVLIGALTVTVISMAVGLIGMEVYRHQRVVNQLEQALSGLSPQAKSVQEKRRASSLVNGVISQRRHLAQTLSGIFQNLPEAMSLEALNYERSRQEWSLRGSAASTQTVLNYIAQLEQLPQVRAVRLKYSRQRQTLSGERIDFEVLVTAASEA